MNIVPAPADRAHTDLPEPSRLRAMYRAAKTHPILGPPTETLKGLVFEHIYAPPVCKSRVADVLASPDYARIPRVEGAGGVSNGILTMHNGLKVLPESYYGHNMLYVFRRTGGVHEPRQEYLFGSVLETLKPGAVIVELGSFWAFYSLWFRSKIDDSRAIMVEPDPDRLQSGRDNFSLNGLEGEFVQGYVGEQTAMAEDNIAVLQLDELCQSRSVSTVSVLHADIQGAESDMLRGAKQLLSNHAIENVFLSTHGADLHAECRSILEGHGFEILDDTPGSSSDSVDGLLFARHGSLPPLGIL